MTELGATIKQTNRLLSILIVRQNPVRISAISESEAAAREWDLQEKSIDEINASLPPKESFSDFLKRMRQDETI